MTDASPRRAVPTSTCWSSAPASPASTSCTAPAKPASRRVLLEAGGGVGGTWYWNRYPGARFDSESYTYALPVLEGAVRGVGVAGALRASSRRPSATSTTWSTASTSGATCGSTPRSPRPSTTRRRRRGPWSLDDGDRAPHALPRRRDRCPLGAVLPRRAGTRGLPRRVSTTPGCGRRRPSTSRASASPSSAPDRAASS